MNRSTQSKSGAYRKFMAMTPAQRAADVAQFDREDLTPGKPLTATDRAMHRQAAIRGKKAKRGRPVVGEGTKMVPITIERGLLKAADEFAKRNGYKRSQMVADGLRLVMARPRAKAG